ncbi:hypothetical protein PENSPDRAFT_737504 [Peniophora sp. CONT]|nr:hypothetical protein PENSPDRAFT_737504 [Peniophora sp. CONT]
MAGNPSKVPAGQQGSNLNEYWARYQAEMAAAAAAGPAARPTPAQIQQHQQITAQTHHAHAQARAQAIVQAAPVDPRNPRVNTQFHHGPPPPQPISPLGHYTGHYPVYGPGQPVPVDFPNIIHQSVSAIMGPALAQQHEMLTKLTATLVADVKKIQAEAQNEQMQNRKVLDAVANEIEKERKSLELAGNLISGRLDVLEKAIGMKPSREGSTGLAARLDELEHTIGELRESMADPQAPIEIPQPAPVTHEMGTDPIPELAQAATEVRWASMFPLGTSAFSYPAPSPRTYGESAPQLQPARWPELSTRGSPDPEMPVAGPSTLPATQASSRDSSAVRDQLSPASTVIDGDQTLINTHSGQLVAHKSSGVVASSVSPRELTIDSSVLIQNQNQDEDEDEVHDAPSPLSELTDDENDLRVKVKKEKMGPPATTTQHLRPLTDSASAPLPNRLKRERGESTSQPSRKRSRQSLAPSQSTLQLSLRWPKLPKDAKKDESFFRTFITCEGCKKWYHFGCVGIKKGDERIKEDSDVTFLCPSCELLPAHQRPAPSNTSRTKTACQRPGCPKPKATNGKDFFVEKLVGRKPDKHRPGEYLWLVEWAGYPIEQCTWQHEEDMGDSPTLIREFVAEVTKEGKSMLPEEHVYLEAAAAHWRR